MAGSAIPVYPGPAGATGATGAFAANINVQTGVAYTLVNSDKGKLVTLDNAAAIALDVDTGLDADFFCNIMQKGAGQVTIGGTATVNNADGATKTEKQWALASIISLSSDVFVSEGRLVT